MTPGESIMLFPYVAPTFCEQFATRFELGRIRSSLAYRRRIHPEQVFLAYAVNGGICVKRLA